MSWRQQLTTWRCDDVGADAVWEMYAVCYTAAADYDDDGDDEDGPAMSMYHG